jgi:hypothetical protein
LDIIWREEKTCIALFEMIEILRLQQHFQDDSPIAMIRSPRDAWQTKIISLHNNVRYYAAQSHQSHVSPRESKTTHR